MEFLVEILAEVFFEVLFEGVFNSRWMPFFVKWLIVSAFLVPIAAVMIRVGIREMDGAIVLALVCWALGLFVLGLWIFLCFKIYQRHQSLR